MVEHSEHEWEQQHEQLSALLDDELDTEQRAALEAHLTTCARCRAELESLRRTQALVRALPQPTLPRSFALPVAAAPRQTLPRQETPTLAPARRASRRPVQVLQWFSSIAAVLGILVLLSSAIVGHAITNGTASTAALGSSQNQPASSGQLAPTPTSPPERTASTQPALPTPVQTAGPTSATPGTAQGHTTTPTSPSGVAGLDFETVLSSTGLGALLLILGACGFALTWALRRRW